MRGDVFGVVSHVKSLRDVNWHVKSLIKGQGVVLMTIFLQQIKILVKILPEDLMLKFHGESRYITRSKNKKTL